MPLSASTRLRFALWALVLFSPVEASFLTGYFWQMLHAHVGILFTLAACLAAAVGGLLPALVAAILNIAALNVFSFLRGSMSHSSDVSWSLGMAVAALSIGYARERLSAAELLAGRLSTDLGRLRNELASQRSDVRRFHDLSVRLSSSLEPGLLLSDLLVAIAGLHDTDLAMLLFLDDSSESLQVKTYTGFTREQIELFGELPVAFFSLQHRVLVEDVERPGADFPFLRAASQVGFRAVFSTPILNSKGEPRGVVATFFRNPGSPSDRQSKLVELYVRQAANALENARLYRDSLDTLAAEQHRTTVLHSLAEASLLINSLLSLDELLQIITDQARKIVGTERAFTTIVPKGNWTQSITSASVPEGQPAMPLPIEGSELFSLVCSLKKTVRLAINEGHSYPWNSLAQKSETVRQGWLAAPLRTRDGRNLGLIQLCRKIDGDFSEDDESILAQLAHMASVAIDNVRLYDEAQDQIAATRRVQEALSRSQESMQMAQRCAGIGIWEWDLQNGTVEWSEESRRLHGVEAGQFDGQYQSWIETIHSEDRHLVHRSMNRAMVQKGDYQVQYRVVSSDKSIHWLESRGQAIMVGDAPVRIIGVAIDITARKQHEEMLRSSERAAATGRLAASISHEINNPLASVTNALYILRNRPEISEQTRHYVVTAEAELARVAHITKQTVALYHEAPSPVPVSVVDLLNEMLMVFSGRIKEKEIMVFTKYGDIEEINGIPAELRQLFSNLFLNAIESLPAGGRIAIRVSQDASLRGKGFQVTFADNGPGIPVHHLPKIFEPFFTTKDLKGAGLGLWVSQGIVQKHGGTIRVRTSSNVNRHGTCFLVYLPCRFLKDREPRDLNPEFPSRPGAPLPVNTRDVVGASTTA
ncbi:MAG TPA: ATP-binding protein [Candidatus Angelobacter sp.]|nr:ATP-binding protein [Candidatus Angelobacter sp.]